MPTSDVADIRAWLESRIGAGVRLGLSTCAEMLDRLGNPQSDFPSIHVAGTNGKGSLCVSPLGAGLDERGPDRALHLPTPGHGRGESQDRRQASQSRGVRRLPGGGPGCGEDGAGDTADLLRDHLPGLDADLLQE